MPDLIKGLLLLSLGFACLIVLKKQLHAIRNSKKCSDLLSAEEGVTSGIGGNQTGEVLRDSRVRSDVIRKL